MISNRIESIEMNVFHKDDKNINVNIDDDDDAIDIAIDLDLDEEVVLKRYLTLFKLLKKRPTNKLIKKSNIIHCYIQLLILAFVMDCKVLNMARF